MKEPGNEVDFLVYANLNKELKHRNISSRRKSIFREWTGLRTAFLARIFNLSSARITTTDARRVKRRENLALMSPVVNKL